MRITRQDFAEEAINLYCFRTLVCGVCEGVRGVWVGESVYARVRMCVCMGVCGSACMSVYE